MTSQVYIIILNYKNWRDVVECLDSILQLDYKDYKIFVVDNNSQNDSLQEMMKWIDLQSPIDCAKVSYQHYTAEQFSRQINIENAEKISFIQNSHNNGFAAGNNLVLRQIAGKDAYVWLLNPDMVVGSGSLGELVKFAQTHHFKSIIGAIVMFYADRERIHLYGGAKINFNSATVDPVITAKEVSRIDYIGGGSLFAHATHFEQLGLLPEDYFLYWEETDWCYNAKQNGYQMLVCPDAVCYDKISTTIGKSYLAEYYYTRNGLIFVSRYRNKKLPVAIAVSFLRCLKKAVTGQWKRSRGVLGGIMNFLKRKNADQ
jgi:GT2 family glycosyltransferase